MGDSAADVESHGGEEGGALETAKDLFAGAVGGVAQVLIGEFFFSARSSSVPFLLLGDGECCAAAREPPAGLLLYSSRLLRRACVVGFLVWSVSLLTPQPAVARPALRHRQGAAPDVGGAAVGAEHGRVHLAARGPAGLLQGHADAAAGHRGVRVDPVRSLPPGAAVPGGGRRRRPAQPGPVLRGGRVRRRGQ